ncbi:MAG: 3-deoxy-manno-octulosonate cytidylyltransferase, partial [Chitinophagaceae bacterium]
MKFIALIPARLAATRFPNKLMQKLGDKTVIATVYAATKNTGLFNEVIVVTDSEDIKQEIEKEGGTAIISKKEHESGTDRIAEVAAGMEDAIIVNVQGDTPFINAESLKKLLDQFNDESVQVASIMQVLPQEEVANPNSVKVCVANNGNALYFSRSVIPFARNKDVPVTYYKHIGVYAFRKKALVDFTKWPVSILENIEKLEQLRYLENGVAVRMVLT